MFHLAHCTNFPPNSIASNREFQFGSQPEAQWSCVTKNVCCLPADGENSVIFIKKREEMLAVEHQNTKKRHKFSVIPNTKYFFAYTKMFVFN